MKIASISKLAAGLLSGLLVMSVSGQTTAYPAKEKQFTGKIEYVNSDEDTVTVKGWIRHRTFNMGNKCDITLWNNPSGTLDGLRPGQYVVVGYKDVNGVLAADRVDQKAMTYSGIVKVIDPARRQLVLRHHDHNKAFMLAEDCRVMLHGQENGALDTIKPGDHVTLVYEAPAGSDVVWQIDQPSVSFVGSVVAIDLPHHSVSLAGTFGSKRFSLANDCSIVMEGRIDAPLMEVRPGERLTINYNDVNGVDVANRIALAEGQHDSTTAQVNR